MFTIIKVEVKTNYLQFNIMQFRNLRYIRQVSEKCFLH